MNKKLKIILLIALTMIIIYAVYALFFSTCCAPEPKQKSPKELRLADPDLLYFSSWWSGMCRNSAGEEGGCYGEMYFYNTGKFIKESGWTGYDGKKQVNPGVEKQLDLKMVENIKDTIRTSGIMAKNCSTQEIMDAGWNYEINLDGAKKSFRNPPEDCKATFEFIDGVVSGDLPKE
jgi:hypothetical protein